MNTAIVFYSARKTSLCERALAKCIAPAGMSVSGASFATGERALGEKLEKAFEENDAVFLIGGLDFSDSRSAVELISKALPESGIFARRIKDSEGDGYLVSSGRQLLVMLPDEPERIETMLSGDAAAYLAARVWYGQPA